MLVHDLTLRVELLVDPASVLVELHKGVQLRHTEQASTADRLTKRKGAGASGSFMPTARLPLGKRRA